MTVKIVRKRGREYFVIDTRPSKAIRKAKAKSQKRALEIYKHFSINTICRDGDNRE